MVRNLNFLIKEVQGEVRKSGNKGADLLRGYCTVDLLIVFSWAKKSVRSEIRRICSRTETYQSLKNGTNCSPFGIQIFRVGLGLFTLVSVLCDREWLGLDTKMRQHYDVEHSIEPPKITNEALRPLSQPDTVLV